jgi:hypothetical protein
MTRAIFTDGANSAVHFVLGTINSPVISVLFLGYQFGEYLLIRDTFFPEITEYAIGAMITNVIGI